MDDSSRSTFASPGDELFGSVFERGDIVFRRGDPGDAMYVIQSGAVEVRDDHDGREVVLALLESGDFFGEMALLGDAPRVATVTTISRTRLLPLTRRSFLERVRTDPGVALHVIEALSERIERSTRQVRDTFQGDERLRIATERRRRLASATAPEQQQPSGADVADAMPVAETRETESPSEDLADFWSRLGDRNRRTVEAGEVVFREGDPADAMYLIVEGAVDISLGEGADRTDICRFGSGEFFGEIALVTRRGRTATATAAVESRLLTIEADHFDVQVRAMPELALYVVQALIARLHRTQTIITDPEGSVDAALSNLPPRLPKRHLLSLALVSLSSCTGCMAVFVDDSAGFAGLTEQARVTYCPLLMDEERLGEVDLAVVEGAVRTRDDLEKLAEVRQQSRYICAWGTCAALGGVPAMANRHELEELIDESFGAADDAFNHYLSGTQGVEHAAYDAANLGLLRKAGKIGDFVKVDYVLPGCPPPPGLLVELLRELRGGGQELKSHKTVCGECARKPDKTGSAELTLWPSGQLDPGVCIASSGTLCLGFITKGGCGAVCTGAGLPCWGCRGQSVGSLKKTGQGETVEELAADGFARRCRQPQDAARESVRTVRNTGNTALSFDLGTPYEEKKLR